MGCGMDPTTLGSNSPPAYSPIEYVPVHPKSAEPSALIVCKQVPVPLMPLYFPVPLRIFIFWEKGFVMSVEADPSYV
jgi:hypothetical protein